MEKDAIRDFESRIIETVTPLFSKGVKLYYKWYGLKKDMLTQYGTIDALLNSSQEQLLIEIFEDHTNVPKVITLFFDDKFNEIPFLTFSTGWRLGHRISDKTGDNKFELTDPKNVSRVLNLNTNLYSKAFKNSFLKLFKFESFEEFEEKTRKIKQNSN